MVLCLNLNPVCVKKVCKVLTQKNPFSGPKHVKRGWNVAIQRNFGWAMHNHQNTEGRELSNAGAVRT